MNLVESQHCPSASPTCSSELGQPYYTSCKDRKYNSLKREMQFQPKLKWSSRHSCMCDTLSVITFVLLKGKHEHSPILHWTHSLLYVVECLVLNLCCDPFFYFFCFQLELRWSRRATEEENQISASQLLNIHSAKSWTGLVDHAHSSTRLSPVLFTWSNTAANTSLLFALVCLVSCLLIDGKSVVLNSLKC